MHFDLHKEDSLNVKNCTLFTSMIARMGALILFLVKTEIASCSMCILMHDTNNTGTKTSLCSATSGQKQFTLVSVLVLDLLSVKTSNLKMPLLALRNCVGYFSKFHRQILIAK